jgi:hypothetical protein
MSDFKVQDSKYKLKDLKFNRFMYKCLILSKFKQIVKRSIPEVQYSHWSGLKDIVLILCSIYSEFHFQNVVTQVV